MNGRKNPDLCTVSMLTLFSNKNPFAEQRGGSRRYPLCISRPIF